MLLFYLVIMQISKPISKFPAYSELIELSTHYYKNQLKLVLKTDYDILYLLALNDLNEPTASLTVSLLVFNDASDAFTYPIAEHTSQCILDILDAHEKSRFEDEIAEPGEFISWCLLSDLFAQLEKMM